MKMITRALCLLMFFVTLIQAQAQPSDDANFNPLDVGLRGIGFTELSGTTAVYRNPGDGSLIVAGIFARYNGDVANRLAHITSTGQHISSFSSGSGVAGGFTPETGMPSTAVVTKIIPVSGNKFLLVGNFRTYQGINRGGIVRILADGANDPSFNSGGIGGDGIVNDALVLPNGDIIIGGSFINFNGSPAPRLARLTADGALVSGFNPGNGPNSAVFALDSLSNGNLVIAGSFSFYNGNPMRRVGIINRNTGEVISGFGLAFNPNGPVARIKVLPNDNIVCAGAFTSFNNVPTNRFTIISSTNGAFASGYTLGSAFNAEVNSVTLLPDGGMLVSGGFTSYNGTPAKAVALLQSNGTINSSFNPQGFGPGNLGFPATVAFAIPTSPGKYLIGGGIKEWEMISYYGLIQVTENGQPDPTFNPATGATSAANVNFDANEPARPEIKTMANQPDGKLIIGGHFTKYNGVPRRFLARLMPDGTLDESFNAGGLRGADNIVHAVAVMPDGKVVVAGRFLFFGNTRRNNLLRLNTDGSLDETWNPVNQVNGRVGVTGNAKLLLPLEGGKLLIAGGLTTFNLVNTIRGMVILNADGSVDASFNSAIKSGTVNTVLAMPDGKFVVGGTFLRVNNGTTELSRNLFRLNADGSFDATFNNGASTTSEEVTHLTLLPNNRIAVGGDFTFINGNDRNGLAILNTDGTIRSEFVNLRFGNRTGIRVQQVVGIRQLSDGSLLVAGQSNGNSTFAQRSGVTIIIPNGNNGNIPAAFYNSSFRVFGNYTFPSDDNFTEGVLNTAFLTDDGAVVAGAFTRSGQRSRNNITRLLINNLVTPVSWGSFTVLAQPDAAKLQWTTLTEQNNRGFYVERSSDGRRFDRLSFVPAFGHGNSIRPLTYTFIDNKPHTPESWYRLSQVDHDGTTSFSVVQLASWRSSHQAVWQLTQNPAANKIALQGIATDRPATASLYNTNGQLLATYNLTGPRAIMDIGHLTGGVYMLQVVQGNEHKVFKVFRP